MRAYKLCAREKELSCELLGNSDYLFKVTVAKVNYVTRYEDVSSPNANLVSIYGYSFDKDPAQTDGAIEYITVPEGRIVGFDSANFDDGTQRYSWLVTDPVTGDIIYNSIRELWIDGEPQDVGRYTLNRGFGPDDVGKTFCISLQASSVG